MSCTQGQLDAGRVISAAVDKASTCDAKQRSSPGCHETVGSVCCCVQVCELSGSLATAQQQLAAAQAAQAADAATAEQRLKLLHQQLKAAEAGLMRRMTGGCPPWA